MTERERLEHAIAALEAQRAVLGDEVVETALAPLREKLSSLQIHPSEQQRKQATVLFADLSGFTTMSEAMDAEEVNEVMNALWRRLDAVIVEHGGVIDKHMGDAVMALWGAEVAREDDPEQAVRAALTMQMAAQELAADRSLQMLQVRIGVNTGPVLFGELGTIGEYTAMGDTINAAQRLERTAPPGSVLISHNTYRHVRGVFDVLSLDPIVVKGKGEPLQVYQVLQLKPRAFRMRTRGVEGIETRMVGRGRELQTLQRILREVFESSLTRVVTIVGDAGVGKSRLLYEFNNWIDLEPYPIYYFKGRGGPEMINIPHGLVRDMFMYRFGIRESDSAAEALLKFREGMAGALGAEQADLVGHLIGFDFSASPAVQNLLGDPSFGQTARSYLAHYLRSMASAPTVVFLEDVHWADHRSLDLIEYLVAEVPDACLMIVCLARPQLFERRASWGECLSVDRPVHMRFDLQPLSEGDSGALVDEILQKVDAVPEPLRRLIVEGAEGNPFYVEELVKMLIEEGVIIRGEERWRVQLGRLPDVRVPPTLTGVLQARLDTLPRDEKAVLQRASVVGRLFWNSAVAELVAEDGESSGDRVDALLDTIRGRELVFRRDRSAFEGTEEYIFKHAILRDVTYETVLLRLRRIYHARIARWLEENAGERLGEYLGLIALHYELAGDVGKAVEYLVRSGQELINVAVYHDAIEAFQRALALLQPVKSLLELPEDAQQLRVTLLLNLGAACRWVGRYPEALEYLEQARALAEEVGDRGSLATIWTHLSDIAFRAGNAMEAERRAHIALEMYRELDAKAGIGFALKALGMAATLRDDQAGAERYYMESLAAYREVGGRQGEAACLINLGEVARHVGRYEDARDYYLEALEINQEIGNRLGQLFCYNNVGNVYIWLDQETLAWENLRRALVEAAEMRVIYITLEAVMGIAILRARSGHHESAAEMLGLVTAHPAFGADSRLYVEPIIDLLRQALPAEAMEAAMARGRSMDLERVVPGLMVEGD